MLKDIIYLMWDRLKQLTKKSYSPYSNFAVAVLFIFEDGKIVEGVNVENSSYAQTICAEKTATTQLFVLGYDPKKVREIHIYSPKSDDFLAPCGSCRQVMSEHFLGDTKIFMYNNKGKFICWEMDKLIPLKINLAQLKIAEHEN